MQADQRTVLDRRSAPFIVVTKAVIEDRDLKAADKSVYAVLCMYADNRTSDCYPRRETIMKAAGVSDHSLRKSLRKLSEKGYIEVKHRYNQSGQASNLYVLLDVPG